MDPHRDSAAERPRPPGPESPRRPNGAPPERRWGGWRPWLILAVFVLMNALLAPILVPEPIERVTVPYTLFKEQIQAGNVIEITSRGDAVQGAFRTAVTWPAPTDKGVTSTRFETRAPAFDDQGLMPLLESKGVIVNARPLDEGRAWWISLLISIAPAVLIFGLLFWMSSRVSQAQSGAFGLGRSRAKRYSEERPGVTFADVAGIDEAEAELEEIVDFLKNPAKYQRLGGTIPKGVLLVGAPGTGKTLLARAVAGEAGVPFFSLSASEFVEMIVGVGASRVRDLFAQAKKEAPAIVFVDELDAIGRSRGVSGGFGGHDEREQTLNQLLVEMDGFNSREAVIILAATNRPDVLDPALLRPGRFDRRVTVQRPDRIGREKILEVHTRGVPLGPDVRLADLAQATPGLVGAELRNLVNEAALLAARKDKDAVGRQDFSEAMEKIILGAARHIAISAEDRRRVAFHEAGHALIGLLMPDADPVHKVSIVPRGQALGVTYQMPIDDRHNYPRDYLLTRITGALGGRAAEQIVFNDMTTGAENDLQQVTALARQMVTRWGMSDEIGLLSLDPVSPDNYLGVEYGRPRWYSEATAQKVDRSVRRIVDESYLRAVEMLRAERPALESLAQALLARESLEEEEIRHVVDSARVAVPHPVT
ncbi:MAG: ATP-dependent metallopeptidase FtsH/Yme1/Tma family protein [Chloroflexota bacterium]|nr:MAG: ATP-dependent metallopeptidase FtsH/Yme1/Tma family protein [Chloroflexota bacterium]